LTNVNVLEVIVSRVQLALNVSNLDEAVEFYSKFFKVGPAKVRAGYANFAIEQPPLKLVLFENPDSSGTINHLGVEVFSTEEVTAAAEYLAGEGLLTDLEDQTTCCYAVQDKVWVDGPDASRWEVYTVLDNSEHANSSAGVGLCCVPEITSPNNTSSTLNCC
jgi:catechol 2,3-dioxygenase-like lactoylglutathione lyase family enzyme